MRPGLHLALDLLYMAADYGQQLGRQFERSTKNAAAAAIDFLRTARLEEIVDFGREPPVQHSLAKLIKLSLSRLWDPLKINYNRDRFDWKQLIYWHQGLLFGIMRLFLWGDSDVADELGQIAANATGDDIQEYFDIQRREEKIHSQFFQIVLAEIFDIQGELAELERRFRWRAIPSFKKFFEELRKAVNQLQKHPTLKNLVRVIAKYHMVAEPIVAGRGTLVVGSIFNQERYQGQDLLRGFREGFGLVARDERQHVWAGMVILERLIRQHPELAFDMLEALVEVAELAMGTDLRGWLPEFPELIEALQGRLYYIGITPQAIAHVMAVFGWHMERGSQCRPQVMLRSTCAQRSPSQHEDPRRATTTSPPGVVLLFVFYIGTTSAAAPLTNVSVLHCFQWLKMNNSSKVA